MLLFNYFYSTQITKMKDLRHFTENNQTSSTSVIDRSSTQAFMTNVFGYMFIALALTGVTSWYLAGSPLFKEYLMTSNGPTPLMWIAMFAPLGLVFWMSLGFNKLKASTMLVIFIAYAFLNGVAFSSLFVAYPIGAIYKAFGSAALVFATFAVVGFTTKTDLTKLGNILRIGVFVLIGSMLINSFMVQSSQFDYFISAAGVIIFTGLTAYDVQKLKKISVGVDMQGATTRKLIIHGALTLYLDFINLFLFLLRLFAGRD